MTAPSLARSLPCLLALAGLSACLKGEKIDAPTQPCCAGLICSNSTISQLTPIQDTEGDDPCMSCSVAQVTTCVDGCGATTDFGINGCNVANTCKTWSRVAAGDACTNDRDCEPGPVGTTTLTCQAGKCADAGASKWASLTPTICTDTTSYGPSASCANGGACIGVDDAAGTRYCSAAKCISTLDCPTDWHCRCQEQVMLSGSKAWRWCVPDVAGTDAGL